MNHPLVVYQRLSVFEKPTPWYTTNRDMNGTDGVPYPIYLWTYF